MQAWLVTQFENVQSAFHFWEGDFNVGFIDRYKAAVRKNGGRVVAVVRLKR